MGGLLALRLFMIFRGGEIVWRKAAVMIPEREDGKEKDTEDHYLGSE